MATNQIVLQGHPRGVQEEAVPAEAMSPGHLLDFNSTANKVKKHDVMGGIVIPAYLIENAIEGDTVDDAIGTSDIARFYYPVRGELMQALLKYGVSYSRRDLLISAGDGTLQKAPNEDKMLLYQSVADSSEVENSTTETLFDTSYTLPANMLAAGDVLRVKAQAFVLDQNSTDTLTLKLYVGGLTGIEIVTTGAVDVADSDLGTIECDIVIRTIGATGTLVAMGTQSLGVPGTVTAKPFQKASTAIDTTASQVIGVSAEWSVAHADNEALLRSLSVELVRKLHPVAIIEEALDLSAASAATLGKIRSL